jgi:hypothetical protein
MQCREACDLLDSFLGQELMVETNHELMRHLEACPDCRGELEARRQLRAVLRRAFSNADALKPMSGFASEALAQIRTAQPKRGTWPSVWTWGAMAASVLLAISAGLFIFGNHVTAIVGEAVGDHRNCAVKFALAQRPIPLAEAAARYDPVYARLEDTPPNELVTAAGPLRVVDRHSCVFSGRRFGHVVLQFEGHLVSLLVTSSEASLDLRTSPRSPSWLPRVEGQNVASFPTPGHTVFIVSDLQDEQFRTVAEALMLPVSSRLAWLFRNPSGVGD